MLCGSGSMSCSALCCCWCPCCCYLVSDFPVMVVLTGAVPLAGHVVAVADAVAAGGGGGGCC